MMRNILAALAMLGAFTVALNVTILKWYAESSLVKGGSQRLRQLNRVVVDIVDRRMDLWQRATAALASEIARRPGEAEALLRSAIAVWPSIVQSTVASTEAPDQLVSRNTTYPDIALTLADSSWVASRIDSSMAVAWIHDTTALPSKFLAHRTFRVGTKRFYITILWDAATLDDAVLRGLSLDTVFAAFIGNTTHAFRILPKFSPGLLAGVPVSPAIAELRDDDGGVWLSTMDNSRSADIRVVTAISKTPLLSPLRQSLLLSSLLIIGLTFSSMAVVWWFSKRIV